jgi:Ca2+-transporting ATPase
VEVVARATAANKLRFVQALMQKGQVVAMTGDGVNDAPALKAASIGVAMGRGGTDVAREASDLVLADDNYATIVSAIEEGRAIYSNIKRFIIFLLSANSGLVFAVFVAALLGWPPILTPTQILWINLITNGLPALALGMEPVHTDPMRHPPRSPDAGLVDLNEVIWLGGYGLFMGAVALFVFYWFGPLGPGAAGTALSIETARTLTFTVLAMAPLFHGLNCRSLEFSVFKLGFFGNGRLWAAFALALALQAVAIYVPWARPVFKTVPLSWVHVTWALGFSMSVWLAGEVQKATFRAFARPE